MNDPRPAARAQARATIQNNIAAKNQLDRLQQDFRDSTPTALLGAHDAIWEQGEKAMERMNPGAHLPLAGKLIARAPSALSDGVQIFTSKDRGRAIAGVVGGRLGGMATGAGLGALVPGFEEITVPVGAVVGGVVGEVGMKNAYDQLRKHKDDIIRAGGDAMTRGWGPSADPVMRRGMLGPGAR